MATILVLQHSVAGPGRLGATLRDHAFKLDIRKPMLPASEGGHELPDDLGDYQGIVLLGGPAQPDQDEPWILKELELIKEAQSRDLPMIGICLGHQLIGRALGGEVGRLDKPEWGFLNVDLTPPGQTDVLLAGVPWSCPQFQSHAYAVTKAPPGAQVLGKSALCANQIMRVGQRTVSFQFHFEADGNLLDYFRDTDADLIAEAGTSEAAFAADRQNKYEMFARVADRICVNLVTYAFTFNALTHA
ncbi:MAG: type 1 glutamine amidotransferase [Phycisphaerales bacterium]|nr:type 1 glutamine amidotransferase [Phycisphaerales bacterium]MCB9835163.1 type 1 glutamine amidotransferase [Phycisphaera sp.]